MKGHSCQTVLRLSHTIEPSLLSKNARIASVSMLSATFAGMAPSSTSRSLVFSITGSVTGLLQIERGDHQVGRRAHQLGPAATSGIALWDEAAKATGWRSSASE